MKSVETLLGIYSTASSSRPFPLSDHHLKIPFSPIVVPFAYRILQDDRLTGICLRPTVQSSLVDSLTRTLSKIAAPSLFSSFAEFRLSAGYHSWGELLPTSDYETRIYDSFCETFLSQYYHRRFFEQRVYLALRLNNSITYECDNLCRLLGRLVSDQARLTREFDGTYSVDRLTAISGPLSDPHMGQQTVRELRFEDGKSLFYKPRNLRGDQIFYYIVDWLKNHNSEVNFEAPLSIDRGQYGWSETVLPNPCTSTNDVKHFYFRLGGLLGLFYVLGTTDIHHENLIACRAFPIPIDLETLVGAPLENGLDHRNTLVGIERVGILPRPRSFRPGRSVV